MSDVFVRLVESKKHIGENIEKGSRAWREMIRSFRNVYSPSHETDVYKFFVQAGLDINEGFAFENRICVAYLYSKGVFDVNGGNLGHALYKAGRDEKILAKIIKCNHGQLLKEIKKLSSLFSSKNIKINPYVFLLDLDSLSNITNQKTAKQVKIEWTEGFFKSETTNGK